MSKFSDGLKKVLGAVGATGIEMALPGPLGTIATGFLAKALGKPEASEEEIAAIVAKPTPEDVAKIRQAEIEFQKFLADNDIKLLELETQDRASARAREMELKDWTPSALAWAYTIGFFGTIAFLLKWGLPTAGDTVMSLLIGALTAGEATILSYYFGSSSGSRSKSATIDALAAK